MAAPTVVVDVHQSANKLPYSLVTMAVAISKNQNIDSNYKWTASGSGTNEYYVELAAGGDPNPSFTSGTITSARAMMTDPTENKYMHMKPGTLGSLNVYEYAWGDNDSLGYNTLYVRMGDSGSVGYDPARSPLATEINLVWDECTTGDAYDWQDCTVDWWADLTDSATAAALSGFGTGDFTQYLRYGVDPRDGVTQIDLLGEEPTAYRGSPVKNPMLQIALPAGTYKWKCRVTNASREQTTVDVVFTVNSETRTVATVNSAGGADYTTIAAAVSAGENLIEVEPGHSEALSGNLNISGEKLVYFNGTGTKPKITRTPNQRLQIYGDGCGIVGIDTAANGSNSQAGFSFAALLPSCRNNYTAACHIVPGSSGQFASGYTFGSGTSFVRSAQNCAVFDGRILQTVTSYSVALDNSNFCAQRCGLYFGTMGPSLNESAFRTTGMVTLCVALYVFFNEDSKDSVRQSYGEGYFWYGCKTDGANRLGETGSEYHKAMRGRWDSCLLLRTATTTGLKNALGTQDGVENYTIVNCVGKDEVGYSIFVAAGSLDAPAPPYVGYQNNKNNRFIHNSCWMSVDSATAFNGNGFTDDTYSIDCEFKNNVVALQSSYTAIENTPNNKYTIANNDSIVGNLDAAYQISGTSTNTTEPGAYYDYNGYVRGTTSLNGASINDPTPVETPVPKQLPSVGLYPVRKALTNPQGHVPVVCIGDSNTEYRDQRVIGGIRGVWEVTHKKIALIPNTGGIGQTSGAYTQVINVGGAAITNSNIDPGDSVLGTSGLLTGLSSSTYRYPGDALKGVWASEPTNPHFSRWVVYKMTHGTDMQDASGTTGANYPLGDPTVGDSIRFYWSELVNTDGNTWSMQLQTDSDPEGDSTWANSEVHGYATDAFVPSTALGIKVWSRTTPQTNTADGMSVRVKHTSTDEGARTGRQAYLGHAWFDNESVDNGCSFWTCAVGGWQTTDHMPSSVGGTPNTDSKYDLAQAAEWLAKCVAPDSDVVYFRIQIGQNNVSSGAFAEGSGTDLGEYANNIGHILDYWRLICTAAGKTPYFYLVSTQNTIIGGARMKAMAEALRDIALANTDVGFFDLRGAVIDAGFTDGDFIMTSAVSSEIYPNRIHTNQNGMYEFAALEWEAISTATQSGNLFNAIDFAAIRRFLFKRKR